MCGVRFESCTTFENTTVPKNMPTLDYALTRRGNHSKWQRARNGFTRLRLLACLACNHLHSECVTQPPSTDELRDVIGRTLQAQVKNYDLARVCAELGITTDQEKEVLSKWRTVLNWLPSDRSAVLTIADRVLERYPDFQLEELVWKATEESPEFTVLARRQIIRALSELPNTWGQLGADAVMGQLFPLGESLRNAIAPELEMRNITEVCSELSILNISGRRFRKFIERLVDPNVRDEDEQANYVATLNAPLRLCGWTLQATSEDSGRTIYTVQRIQRGVGGRPKHIIFASQIKPDLRFIDAVNSDIEIVNHADKVLIYDRPIPSTGLNWRHLQHWWAEHQGLDPEARETKESLYRRLYASLPENSPPQKLLFRTFHGAYSNSFEDLPALLPEVWLYYDPVTVKRRGRDALLHQRMDFLLLFSHSIRVVLEVDGAHHYSKGGRASPKKYAEMVASDRELRLSGYDVYRFGASELEGPQREATVKNFFGELFRRYG
jgi:hypothetical protein